MDTSGNLGKNEPLVVKVQGSAQLLIDKLQDNNFEAASNLIHELYTSGDNEVYQSVGKLTRALHSAIVNFNVDADIAKNDEVGNASEISDATDRLQYVITMTQEAADKTMDRVETAAPIALNLKEEAAKIQTEWAKLKRRELSKEDFSHLYGRVDDFLGQLNEGADQLNSHLQAIILEQGFQDLTGQVLKKVIGLITDVENELVNLVRLAGQVEEETGICIEQEKSEKKNGSSVAAEGPQIHADIRDDVVSGQDDVDDLLSSLGF